MSVPVSQMWTVASYVIRQKARWAKQYPLVLMLGAAVSAATWLAPVAARFSIRRMSSSAI